LFPLFLFLSFAFLSLKALYFHQQKEPRRTHFFFFLSFFPPQKRLGKNGQKHLDPFARGKSVDEIVNQTDLAVPVRTTRGHGGIEVGHSGQRVDLVKLEAVEVNAKRLAVEGARASARDATADSIGALLVVERDGTGGTGGAVQNVDHKDIGANIDQQMPLAHELQLFDGVWESNVGNRVAASLADLC
jgi:hypothetical protein